MTDIKQFIKRNEKLIIGIGIGILLFSFLQNGNQEIQIQTASIIGFQIGGIGIGVAVALLSIPIFLAGFFPLGILFLSGGLFLSFGSVLIANIANSIPLLLLTLGGLAAVIIFLFRR